MDMRVCVSVGWWCEATVHPRQPGLPKEPQGSSWQVRQGGGSKLNCVPISRDIVPGNAKGGKYEVQRGMLKAWGAMDHQCVWEGGVDTKGPGLCGCLPGRLDALLQGRMRSCCFEDSLQA
jgi:hypothetical protein